MGNPIFDVSGSTIFNQTGGTNSDSGDLDLDNCTYSLTNSNAALSVGGGGLFISDGIATSEATPATFVQSAGSVSASVTWVGGGASQTGYYFLSGGTLTTGAMNLEGADESNVGGIFTQTGGSVTIGTPSSPGNMVMFNSSYSMDDSNGPSTLTLHGDLSMGSAYPPGSTYPGSSSFSQTGGSATIDGDLVDVGDAYAADNITFG